MKSIIRKILPNVIVKSYRRVKHGKQIKNQSKQYDRKLQSVSQKKKIKIVFFVIHSSVWKYDGVYKLFSKDSLFEPLIIVCPYLKVEENEMKYEMDKTYQHLLDKGYNVIKSFDSENNRWINVKESYQPDIVFFSVPYSYTRNEYTFERYRDSLTCYVPYFFVTNGKSRSNYGSLFHNLVWKVFYETDIHKRIAEKFAMNNGGNIVVSGYPGLDHFLFENNVKKDPWKINDPSVKRIIWAPHHTIEGQGVNLDYSNFKKYHNFFKQLLFEYKETIQIAFKPHPLLKEKLYKDPDWGKAKTNDYYSYWGGQENSMLCESDYVNLFLTSDALIHDCSSFMAEYLSTHKPCLYLLHDNKVRNRLNEFGRMALEQHYLAINENEILSFIQSLLKSEDPKKYERKNFIKDYLLPPNNRTASENIYEELKKSISNGK